MITNLLLLTIAVYVIGNAGGYFMHWLLHQKWTGRPYRDHYNHHFKIYPPSDYLSLEYREPPIEAEQAKYYVPFFLLLATPALFWHWGYYLVAVFEAIAVLKANAAIHDALHVIGHRWERWEWFQKYRALHFEHHVDTRKNLGIFSFFADRLVRTYSPVDRITVFMSSNTVKTWMDMDSGDSGE